MDTGGIEVAYDGPARYLDELVSRFEAAGATVDWERPEIPDWDDYGQTHVVGTLRVTGADAVTRRVVSHFREYCPSARIGVHQPT